MKPQELRIGNYVATDNGFPMFITALGEDWVQLDFKENVADIWDENLDDVHPCKITEYREMLEDMGFEYNENENKYRALIGGYHVTLIPKGKRYALAIEELEEQTGYYYDVVYIHDLQNKIFDTIEITLQ